MTRPAHALVSYWYLRKPGTAAYLRDALPDGTDFFLDSGAYSAKNSGADIDIEDYMAFIRGNEFSVYANLDVIGDPAGSAENYRIMRSNGLTPLPVFHGGEPWSFLDGYLADDPPYIALGGIAKALGALRWCAEVFSRVPSTTRIHGFGQTKYPLLRALPWYSVDSTSHGALARWAEFMGFDGHNVVSISLKKYKIHKQTKHDLARIVRHGLSSDFETMDLLNTDLTAKRLRDGSATKAAERLGYAAGRTAARVEEWCLNRHGPISGDGLKIYLALGSTADAFAVKGMADYFTERELS